MSHKSLRTLIEKTVRDIQDDVQYSYVTETDANQTVTRSYLKVNTSPLTASGNFSNNNVTNYSKAWNVQMAFYKPDTEASLDYADILDQTDDLVDRFLNKLNLQTWLTITGFTQTPFIKVTADILTGHLLTLTVTLTDDFDYCVDC